MTIDLNVRFPLLDGRLAALEHAVATATETLLSLIAEAKTHAEAADARDKAIQAKLGTLSTQVDALQAALAAANVVDPAVAAAVTDLDKTIDAIGTPAPAPAPGG